MKPKRLVEGKKQYIVESCPVGLELLEETEAQKLGFKGEGIGFVRATGMNAGRITLNSTLYPRTWVAAQLAMMKPLLVNSKGKGKVGGKADHSYGVLRNAVRWIEARLNDQWDVELYGLLLDCEPGRDIKGQLAGGLILDLSSVTYGSVTEKTMTPKHPEWELNKEHEGEKFYEIDEDDVLKRWDFVDEGSNEGAETEDRKPSLETFDPDEYGEDTMKIKTLADLLKAVDDKDTYEAILAEARAGFKAEADAKTEADAQIATATAEAVTKALKDPKQVQKALEDEKVRAECLTLKPEVMAYAEEHAEALEKLAKDKAKPVAEGAKPEPKGEVEERLVKLEGLTNDLTTQLAESDKARKASDRAVVEMRQKLNKAEADKLLEECTKGETPTVRNLILRDLRKDGAITLDENFDAENAESLKAAKEKVTEAVKAIKDELKAAGVNGEQDRKTGLGLGPEHFEEPADEVEQIKKGREKFAKEHKSLELKLPHLYESYLANVASLGDPATTASFVRFYGPAAQKIVPLQ